MGKDIDSIALKTYELSFADCKQSAALQLLTRKEKITLGRRVLIAQSILSGKTRFEINEKIGVSPNTFAQINRWLESDFATYASAHTTQVSSRKQRSKYLKPFSYEHLKQKHPAHFLLFTLTEELWKKK